MIVAFLLSMAALWNLALQNDSQNEGWIVFFLFLLLGSGVAMFFIAYRISDHEQLDLYVQSMLENEKDQINPEKQDSKEVLEAETENTDKIVEDTVSQLLSRLNTKTMKELCNQFLRRLSKQLAFNQGIIYIKEKRSKKFMPEVTFALTGQKPESFVNGEGILGQAAENKTVIRITDIPEKYFDSLSGLGNAKPKNLLFIPLVYKNKCIALIEAGSFKKPDAKTEKILERLSVEAGQLIHNCISE